MFLNFAFFSIILSWLDINYGEIPRAFSMFMLVCVIACQIATSSIQFAEAIFAAVIFGFVYFATQKKMGLADIWYAIGAGFVLGIKYFIISVLSACVTAGIFFAISHFAQKKGKTEKSIPFIPFLTMGYFFSLFCYYLA